MNTTTIGENIKKWRSFRGIKQQTFADTLGISRQTLSRYENGKVVISLHILQQIANVLKINYDELLNNAEN